MNVVDPIVGSIATAVGKEVVSGVAKEIHKRSNKVDKSLANAFQIEGREMIIKCPESIQLYSLSVINKKKPRLPKKVHFKFGDVNRVSLKPVMSLVSSQDAVVYHDTGFSLDLRKLEPDQLYLLDIEYNITHPRFLESLVYRKSARETPGDECTEYWMVAAMKHLHTFKEEYGYIELRDLDFGVDVAVHQDINMIIPSAFKDQLETISKLTKKVGRDEKFRLCRRLLQLQNRKYGGKEHDILKKLKDLFHPPTFQKYVDVLQDFRYNSCERGIDYYETLPIPTWPKYMKVISRTDLSLDQPVADGVVVYQNQGFKEKVDEIF
jgi:hypothetical protein